MFDFAIRKTESALGRVVFMLFLSAIAMLGLVWLSIAIAGWIALTVPPQAAAAITGLIFVGLSLSAYFISRAMKAESRSESEAPGTDSSSRPEDVISRGMRLAERMAPDTPMAALVVALLAGLGSVRLPEALSPFLHKVMDDVEKLPDARATN